MWGCISTPTATMPVMWPKWSTGSIKASPCSSVRWKIAFTILEMETRYPMDDGLTRTIAMLLLALALTEIGTFAIILTFLYPVWSPVVGGFMTRVRCFLSAARQYFRAGLKE